MSIKRFFSLVVMSWIEPASDTKSKSKALNNAYLLVIEPLYDYVT